MKICRVEDFDPEIALRGVGDNPEQVISNISNLHLPILYGRGGVFVFSLNIKWIPVSTGMTETRKL